MDDFDITLSPGEPGKISGEEKNRFARGSEEPPENTADTAAAMSGRQCRTARTGETSPGRRLSAPEKTFCRAEETFLSAKAETRPEPESSGADSGKISGIKPESGETGGKKYRAGEARCRENAKAPGMPPLSAAARTWPGEAREELSPEAVRTEEPLGQDAADTAAAGAKAAPRTSDTPFRLKVKYNHEERELGYGEAVTLAQKGLNYGKLEQRIAELEAAGRAGERLVSALAAGYGLNPDEVESILSECEGAGRRQEAEEFFRSRPELSPSDLPEEVLERFYSGENLSAAYESVCRRQETELLRNDIERLKKELEALQEDRQNAAAANPSAGSLGGSTAGEVYAPEEIDAMSSNELEKNLDRAIRSMSYWSRKNSEK